MKRHFEQIVLVQAKRLVQSNRLRNQVVIPLFGLAALHLTFERFHSANQVEKPLLI